MSGLTWEIDPLQAFGPIPAHLEGVALDHVEALLLFYGPQVEAWMKHNAPWTDRTGNARQSLNHTVERGDHEVALTLAHGVDYGIYLEERNGGHFAILRPAIDYWAQQVFSDLAAAFL
jgi:hypothetical protein